MVENRKRILDRFQEHIFQDYTSFCERHNLSPSTKGFITFLIDKELISPITIKRYTVKQEFEELFHELELHKTKTVNALSDKFQIPERTIWGILKKDKKG